MPSGLAEEDVYIPPDTSGANDGNAGEQAGANYINNASALAGIPADVASIVANISESVSDAGVSGNTIGLFVGKPTDMTNEYANQQGVNNKVSEEPSLLKRVGEKMDAAGSWMETNKKLSELLMGMVGGAYSANEKRKGAAITAQSQIEQQNNAYRIEQEKNTNYSNVVSGLKPAKKGLINQPLKRFDGTPVFSSNGRMI